MSNSVVDGLLAKSKTSMQIRDEMLEPSAKFTKDLKHEYTDAMYWRDARTAEGKLWISQEDVVAALAKEPSVRKRCFKDGKQCYIEHDKETGFEKKCRHYDLTQYAGVCPDANSYFSRMHVLEKQLEGLQSDSDVLSRVRSLWKERPHFSIEEGAYSTADKVREWLGRVEGLLFSESELKTETKKQ